MWLKQMGKKEFELKYALRSYQDYPCRTCTERHEKCHGSCEAYQKTRQEQYEKNKAIIKSKKAENQFKAYRDADYRKSQRSKGIKA